MDTFTTFIQQLDQALAQSQVTPTTVYVPVTFSWQQQHLQVEMPSLRTSFNQGANAFGVADILDRIRQLVGIELMEKPQSQWPKHATAKALTITIHKVVRVIPVDMQVYGV